MLWYKYSIKYEMNQHQYTFIKNLSYDYTHFTMF